MKALGFIAVLATGLLLLAASRDFPDWGDPHSPASSYRLSRHFITETKTETAVPNMVTAVLADYRGYDTLFEAVVIFTAGIAVIGVLRRFGPGKGIRSEVPYRREQISELTPKQPDLIVESTVRLLIPIIQIFALYVIAHGHHSPGGGFQGGVIFGASFILLALACDLKAAQNWVSEKRILILACSGILIYSGIGVLCQLLGENFLDYQILHRVLPVDPVMARYHSILGVEIGVAFTVTAIMFSLYSNLSSNGQLKEGI